MKIKMPECAVASFRDSHDQRPQWNDPSTEFDLEACGRHGGARVKVSVHGYWSDDVLTMYIDRRWEWRNGDDAAVWEVTLTHSSGGRMTAPDEKNYPAPRYKAIADSLEAEENFGIAMIAAAAFGRQIRTHIEALEGFYQQRKAEQEQEREAEKAAKAARIAADEPLGAYKASKLLESAISDIGMWSERRIAVYQRGAEHPVPLVISRKQNTTFRFLGSVTSRKNVLAELAQASSRSHLEV
jgi:hypothetical protein